MNLSASYVATNSQASNGPAMEDLRHLILGFVKTADSYGVKVKPFSDESLARLEILPKDKIAAILSSFQEYYDLCSGAEIEKVNLKDNKAFTLAALRQMGCMAPESFMNTISSEDVVEIYDLSGRQIFRSFNFYEITSYSLADLLTFEWHDLYDRPSTVMTDMFQRAGLAIESSAEVIPMNIPIHLLKEIKAEPIQVSEVHFKNISATRSLKDQSKVGLIVNCHARSLLNEVHEGSLDFV